MSHLKIILSILRLIVFCLLLDFIKKKGYKDVDLQEKIDKSIIGGAIINIGNKQIDASVSNKINEMKQNFSVNLYEQNYLNKQIWEK